MVSKNTEIIQSLEVNWPKNLCLHEANSPRWVWQSARYMCVFIAIEPKIPGQGHLPVGPWTQCVSSWCSHQLPAMSYKCLKPKIRFISWPSMQCVYWGTWLCRLEQNRIVLTAMAEMHSALPLSTGFWHFQLIISKHWPHLIISKLSAEYQFGPTF